MNKFEQYQVNILNIIPDKKMLPIYRFAQPFRDIQPRVSSEDQYPKDNIVYGARTEFGQNVCIEQNVSIGKNCIIGCNVVIRNNTTIGDNCIIGHNTTIEQDVIISPDSTVQCNCYITMGTVIESNVFIAPGVVTCNDGPMVKYHTERGRFKPNPPMFCHGASVGAGATILPGVVVGRDAVVGAGSVVSKNVPDKQKWFGKAAECKDYKC